MVLDFDYFFRQLKAGVNIDETYFYFIDDGDEKEYYLRYYPKHEKPYLAGGYNMSFGIEFLTAEELVNSKIFNGKSLKDDWTKVHICSVEGFVLEDWLNFLQHVK